MDYYSALLTDKQRDIYEWYYQQDLSLGEISEVAKVSRNAVHDLLSRTDEKLERLEKALGLIAAGEAAQKNSEELTARLAQWLEKYGGNLPPEARDSLEELWRLKT
ncbi:MAG: DNA-binding protein [Clostridiales bacterium]|nr:DNA-binding protein [Clostridiales bacterium]